MITIHNVIKRGNTNIVQNNIDIYISKRKPFKCIMNANELPSKVLTRRDTAALLEKAEACKFQARRAIDKARNITPINESSILDASYQSNFLPTQFKHRGITVEPPAVGVPAMTTGGHSNTDHIIDITGDPHKDAISEYKRALMRRARAMQPEERGKERWDQPRIVGSRRRRIVRESDLP